MIIYPPLISSAVPAFTNELITIPFTHNPAVDKDAVKGIGLVIKTYKDSSIIEELLESEFDLTEGWAKFRNLPTLTTNQYYKFQIFYIDNIEEEGVSYSYSNASISKCLGQEPLIYIEELEHNVLNANRITYKGIYERPLESEPSYSHQFVVKDEDNNIIQDSGTIIGVGEVEIGDASEKKEIFWFELYYNLQPTKVYSIEYRVTTVNGYQLSTSYQIVNKPLLNSYYTGQLVASQSGNDYDNGCVSIRLLHQDDQLVFGNFILWRSTIEQNKWDKITEFNMTKNQSTEYTWKDYTIEQGKTYIYAISQISNNGEQSEKIVSNSIFVSFEGMFLSDGNRQLKIAFNPKVSSLKRTIQESKIETLGSQFPYFFRNSIIEYHEIPLSGLISYHQDNDKLFLSNEELNLPENFIKSNNLSDDNFIVERLFKTQVLSWLNNGEPKLFRSAAEGNYILRLMNISLSPEDRLSRMIHSFSATGYEIDKTDMSVLKKYNLLNLEGFTHAAEPIKHRRVMINISNPNTSYAGLKVSKTNNELEEELLNIAVDNNGHLNSVSWISGISPGYDERLIIGEEQNEFVNLVGNLNLMQLENISQITFVSKKGLEFSNSLLVLEYEYQEYQLKEDTFSQAADFSSNSIISVPSGKTINEVLGNRKIYQIFAVGIVRDPLYTPQNLDDNEEFVIYLNDTPIDFGMQEQFRYYTDISSIQNKGKGLHCDIYARIENKEVQ